MSHRDIILTIIVFILNMNIIHIIGEMMGDSCVGILIIRVLIVGNNHGLGLFCRSLLLLIRMIKAMIEFSGTMSWFEACLAYN